MIWNGPNSLTVAAGRPVGIVRGHDGGGQDATPLLILAGGVALAAGLIAAAVVVRRRARAGERSGPSVDVPGALPTLARAMKIGRAEVRVLRRLAAAANVREPAVLLISEYAFRTAAARVLRDSPEARESVVALAETLGFRIVAGAPGEWPGDPGPASGA